MMSCAMREDLRDLVHAAREAYNNGDWADATALFLRADAEAALGIEDLESLVWAAAVSAHDKEMLATLERVYAHHVENQDHARSAQAAFWSGIRNMMIGDVSIGAGWLQRAAKHAAQTEPDCVQRGYLLLPRVFMNRAKGDYETAVEIADEAMKFGEKCDEPDLVALAGSLKGSILFLLGRIDDGYDPIDEVMLLATGAKLSPLVTAIVYCEIVTSCCRVQEMVRAREWTAILTAWCQRNPQARAFGGVCKVHRAEILQLEGNWNDAYSEAEQAGKSLAGTTEQTAMALAAYWQGEILRLRGNNRESEREYRRASEIGIDPQPGFSLLRLSQNRLDDAVSMISRSLKTAADMPEKAALLPAAIEILIAKEDLDAAQVLCAEMASIADSYATEVLLRVADQCHGALAMAQEDYSVAVSALKRARDYWTEFGAPYLVGRLRVDIARGMMAMGDDVSANMELDAAEKLFSELGAAPDLAHIGSMRAASRPSPTGGLTLREKDVLRRMADGETNREIAEALGLSPKTVNRHVENIFDKLEVSSRAAAVAVSLKAGEI